MELDYGAFSIKGKTHAINEDRYRMLGNKIGLVGNLRPGADICCI